VIQAIRYIEDTQTDNAMPTITASIADEWTNIRNNGQLLDGTALCYAELIEGPHITSGTDAVGYVLETVIFVRSIVGGQTLVSKIFSQPHTSIRLS
jgi:hypothetical protein